MNEIIKRLSLPIPAFFSKVRTFGGILSGIGVTIMGLNYEGSKLFDFIKPFGVEFVVAGTVMIAIAQLTVKPEVPNKEL